LPLLLVNMYAIAAMPAMPPTPIMNVLLVNNCTSVDWGSGGGVVVEVGVGVGVGDWVATGVGDGGNWQQQLVP